MRVVADRPPIWVGAGTQRRRKFRVSGRHMSACTPHPPSTERGGDVPAIIRKAAKDGQAGAVLAWLDGGGWVDATFVYTFGDGSRKCGMTVLMVALANGHAELAEALLRRGADVSLQTSNGGTALGLAAANGRENLVELALRHGAEAVQKGPNGITALMDAVYQGHEKIVDTLIRHGAEINVQANNCLLYTSPSPRDYAASRMPSSA